MLPANSPVEFFEARFDEEVLIRGSQQVARISFIFMSLNGLFIFE